VKRKERVREVEYDYQPWFYLHLPDPHRHAEMIEGLESLYRVEECTFQTIYGELDGYKIYCDVKDLRKVAEKIELQTRFQVKLYNVDVRLDQRFFAERRLISDEERFSIDGVPELKTAKVEVKGEKSYPAVKNRIVEVRVNGEVLKGSEREIIQELSSQIESLDPDVILFLHADYWMRFILARARKYGIDTKISRNGRYRKLGSKSYFSYGRVVYRPSAYLPAGRVLIDTANSFNYKEGGLEGVFLASRLACIPANYAARFTPGTLISSYEVYEALKRDIAVPFRKFDAERLRSFEELKMADRGGMIFQPRPGVYENVYQLDFVSMYPSIIVKWNLSPETIASNNGKKGFLPLVLEPLLNLRLETRKMKKIEPKYERLDSILKWMLVTCFGYTGYKNARFGRIEVHEAITRVGREVLIRTKEIAESMGFEVLHGIVDCLWLRGEKIEELREVVEKETGLLTGIDSFSWIVFLPMKDETGAYNRYYGRLRDGSMKVRGVAARRGDTPEYIRKMQMEMFDVMAKARSVEEIQKVKSRLIRIYHDYKDKLRRGDVNPEQLAINRRISKLEYSRMCAEASVIEVYKKLGIAVSPGMNVSFVVVDARKWIVEAPWEAAGYDEEYYTGLLDKVWDKLIFAFW